MHGFTQWAERYTAIFGLTNEADTAMVSAWQAVFDAAGYSAAELEAATDWLVAQGGALTRPQHRPAIQERVRAARVERARMLDEQAERDSAACDLCAGSGLVVVPHLASCTDVQWDGARSGGRLYTFTVSCRCPRGQRRAESYRMPELEKHQANRTRPKLLTLEDYERLNPGWFQQLRRRDQELLARGQADQLAAHAERSRPVGESVAKALRGLKIHKPEVQP